MVAESVSNAVLASRAGYAVGLVRGGGTIEVRDPKLIRIGEMLPSEEIDMSADAALLEAAYAQRTPDEARAPSGTPAGKQPPETGMPAGGGLTMKDEPGAAAGTKSAESSHGGSVDTVGRVELKATVGKDGLFDLSRALAWLRDNASDVHVEISIAAVARRGLVMRGPRRLVDQGWVVFSSMQDSCPVDWIGLVSRSRRGLLFRARRVRL